MNARFTLEERIDAFSLMASLVENVGPSGLDDKKEVRLYDKAQALAEMLMLEAMEERDVRDLIAASVKADPSWKNNMAKLRKLARQSVRTLTDS
jgi:hypothetical protein